MKIAQNRGLCQMGKMAITSDAERVFQASAESKFLSLDGISVPFVNQTLSLWEAR